MASIVITSLHSASGSLSLALASTTSAASSSTEITPASLPFLFLEIRRRISAAFADPCLLNPHVCAILFCHTSVVRASQYAYGQSLLSFCVMMLHEIWA